MKLKIFRILLLLLTVTLTASLPSCRSGKKSKSELYEIPKDNHNGRRHKNDKNDKHVIGTSKTRKRIMDEAYEWMGTPYGFGKADKGKACDCSGLVMSAYERATGIKLPRVSAKQRDFCKKINKKDVKVADLCFFATGNDPDKVSHVGLMIDDRNFIHASSSKGVIISDITQPYWVRTFLGYGRVEQIKD